MANPPNVDAVAEHEGTPVIELAGSPRGSTASGEPVRALDCASLRVRPGEFITAPGQQCRVLEHDADLF